MSNRSLPFAALVFAALTVGMKFAHLLELLPKLSWPADLYFPVQNSLYKFFGIVGPIVDILAILLILVLVIAARKQPDFSPRLISLMAMLVSLAVWALMVAPANRGLTSWLTEHQIPVSWEELRNRWQYGQAICFTFDFSGFCVLLFSSLKPATARS